MVESTEFSDGIDVGVRKREESRMNLRYLSEQWCNLFRQRKLGEGGLDFCFSQGKFCGAY